jgi:hypothetical protein
MTTKSSLVFTFALAFSAFIIIPGFLGEPFPPYPSMHWADIFDLFTPLAVIPLYWLLLRDASQAAKSTNSTIAFLLLVSLWIQGQGMHLAANSISNLMGQGSSAIHDLVHFYDEVLSHYIWHFAIIGLSVLLLWLVKDSIDRETVHLAFIGPAAILYGFTFFVTINEGATVPLGLPAAILIVLLIAFTQRRLIGTHNLVGFFLWGYTVALVFFLGWYLYWGGFPEFSEVGII